jgi:hypothetical protein
MVEQNCSPHGSQREAEREREREREREIWIDRLVVVVVVMHTCNPTTQEERLGGLWV